MELTMTERDICLNSMQTYDESHEEISKQKLTNLITLFGKQVGSMRTQSHKLFEGQQGRNPKLQMRKINLQLPADQYICHLQETTELGNFHGLGNFQEAVDLELSLCLGSEVRAKEASERNWLGKKTLPTVINLEEPPRWFLNKETVPAGSMSFAPPVTCFRRNRESEVPIISDQTISEIVKNDLSVVDDDKCYEKQGYFYQGLGGFNDDKTSNNMLTSKEQFAPCASGLLDLNKVPVEEPMLDLEDCLLHNPNHADARNIQMSCEKSEIEDPAALCSSQSHHIQEKDGTRSPASYTSCCITDNVSRIESRISSPHSSDPISHTQVESQVTETLSSEAEHKCCDKKIEDSYEMEPSVLIAAESLIRISFNNSAQNQDFSPQAGSGDAETECSFDSYELLTLKLTESSPDDYCVSSKPLDEGDSTGKEEDFGYKLRRGRRMKNFQKEILPGLMCLSRHEIREDINILEAVLRSREYKKNMGKMGDRSWCTTLKNKGSKASYVGRRRKSK